eukprot:1685249-Rhodomonas_salina.2
MAHESKVGFAFGWVWERETSVGGRAGDQLVPHQPRLPLDHALPALEALLQRVSVSTDRLPRLDSDVALTWCRCV